MKKTLLLIVLFLTGCSTVHPVIDTSSKCKYDIDGLTCKKEQVWQLRSSSGKVMTVNHTNFWFESHSDCEEFRKDKKNIDFLDESENGYITNCGIDGKNGREPDINNFYIYSDGTTDGDFYYEVKDKMSLLQPDTNSDAPYSTYETFTPIFTSKEALNYFKRMMDSDLFKPDYSVNVVKRKKIKRMY